MLWSPLLGAAAALLIIVMLAGTSFGTLTDKGDLAGISPEMKETQQFYTNLIKTELAKLEAASTPETEKMVNDALAQMDKLDQDYEKLKKDLKKSGQDKRVIFAMISNLQQRIDILTNVMEQIENIKELKNPNNENNII
jgi:septal ring factor EnvC (AmiA/AmiB activator)